LAVSEFSVALNTSFDTSCGKGTLEAVKEIVCLVFLCLFSSVLANEPGQVAMDFLGKVQKGEIDLEPGGDTALQAHTSMAKRKTIRNRIEQLTEQLTEQLAGETTLELGSIREDGNFAAVMVRQVGGFDGSNLQVFPVALVKVEEGWLPAPVLASFENAVGGYTVPLRKRLSELEDWMMRERVVDLDQLVVDSAQRTRRQIRDSLIGEELEGDDLTKIMDGFLKACRERNRAAVLGYLGGLGSPWPSDWSSRLEASHLAISEDASLGYPWRLLVDSEVIRISVHEEKTADSGMVSLACLDPARAEIGGAMGKIVLLHFEFEKDPQGQWQIELPNSLLNNDSDEMFFEDVMDTDLLNRFPAKLREEEPLVMAAEVVEVEKKVVAAMKSGSLRDLLRRVDLSGKSKAARVACSAAAAAWWSLNEPAVFRSPVRLGFREEGILGVAAYQWFSVNQADRFELRPLFFKKTGNGWVWVPGVVSSEERESQKVLSAWLKEKEPEWRQSWGENLLGPSVRLAKLSLEQQAEDSQVRELVENWLAAVEKRDFSQVLESTAWLGEKDEIPSKGLRNLAYEMTNARQKESRLSKIYRSGGWVAVGIVHSDGEEENQSFMPVLVTQEGLRFIPEIDLIAGDNRTRRFLNKASFDRLGNFVGKEDVAALEALFKKFEKEVKVD